jgi:hypothetical protein
MQRFRIVATAAFVPAFLLAVAAADGGAFAQGSYEQGSYEIVGRPLQIVPPSYSSGAGRASSGKSASRHESKRKLAAKERALAARERRLATGDRPADRPRHARLAARKRLAQTRVAQAAAPEEQMPPPRAAEIAPAEKTAPIASPAAVPTPPPPPLVAANNTVAQNNVAQNNVAQGNVAPSNVIQGNVIHGPAGPAGMPASGVLPQANAAQPGGAAPSPAAAPLERAAVAEPQKPQPPANAVTDAAPKTTTNAMTAQNPNNVGSTSWVLQVLAALAGAAAAGVVAWFLIGSTPRPFVTGE